MRPFPHLPSFADPSSCIVLLEGRAAYILARIARCLSQAALTTGASDTLNG